MAQPWRVPVRPLTWASTISLVVLALWQVTAPPVAAFSFTLDVEECFHEHIKAGQSTVVGFVVTRAYNTYSWGTDDEPPEVEAIVHGPNGHIYSGNPRASTDEIYFWTEETGYHKVCFKNLEREHLKVSVEILEYYAFENKKSNSGHVKEEEVDDVHRELLKLQHDVQSAHHDVWYGFYLAAQHIQLDSQLARRVVNKCVFQGLLLVICSVAQVLILKQLFEKRMRVSRV